ncbi:MAG: tetratricopeptide repeat protein, partial [Saprospiraceae bacterium]
KKGHFDRAKELYDRDLKLCRELGDKQGLSITLGLMGDLLLEKGEFEEAIIHLDEQLRLAEELNYQKGIAGALGSLGDTYFHQLEYEKALAVYQRGIRICEEIDNKRMLIMIVMRVVELALIMEKEPEEIRIYSKKADLLADDIGNEELIFMTSVKRAQVEIAHGHKQEALGILISLLEMAPTAEEKSEVLFVLGISPNVPNPEKYRQEGRELFDSLFKKTPKYDYLSKQKMLS